MRTPDGGLGGRGPEAQGFLGRSGLREEPGVAVAESEREIS